MFDQKVFSIRFYSDTMHLRLSFIFIQLQICIVMNKM